MLLSCDIEMDDMSLQYNQHGSVGSSIRSWKSSTHVAVFTSVLAEGINRSFFKRLSLYIYI